MAISYRKETTSSLPRSHFNACRNEKYVFKRTRGLFIARTWFGEIGPCCCYQLCSICLQHSCNHVRTIKGYPVLKEVDPYIQGSAKSYLLALFLVPGLLGYYNFLPCCEFSETAQPLTQSLYSGPDWDWCCEYFDSGPTPDLQSAYLLLRPISSSLTMQLL